MVPDVWILWHEIQKETLHHFISFKLQVDMYCIWILKYYLCDRYATRYANGSCRSNGPTRNERATTTWYDERRYVHQGPDIMYVCDFKKGDTRNQFNNILALYVSLGTGSVQWDSLHEYLCSYLYNQFRTKIHCVVFLWNFLCRSYCAWIMQVSTVLRMIIHVSSRYEYCSTIV